MTEVTGRAPGRLDVMGGIADYSGSLVLQLVTREETRVTLRRRDDRELRVVSRGAAAGGGDLHFAVSLARLEDLCGTPVKELRDELFAGADRWAAYVVGAFLMLLGEGCRFRAGADLTVTSDVPQGKGVASSAALEVATMRAVVAAHDIGLGDLRLAELCHEVEQRIAGAPCGIMDQMTVTHGRPGRLLALRCQPSIVEGHVAIPSDLAFFGIDSGVKHSVAGAAYGRARTAAFMGYRVLAEERGCAVRIRGGRASVTDPEWEGWLSRCRPEQLAALRPALPEQLRGSEFLARYGGITDVVTRVEPDVVYPVLDATRHGVEENARVERFRELLADGAASVRELGELMLASHESYSRCGLGSPETDALVARVCASEELFGARVTGGGSGGTVAVVGRAPGATAAVDRVAREHAATVGARARVFRVTT